MARRLEELIEERKKLAESRNIISKAIGITRYCITYPHLPDRDSGYYGEYKDASNGLEIVARYGEEPGSDGPWPYSSTKITYHGKIVFDESGYNIVSYIPGETCESGNWETILNKLDESAEKVRSELSERAAAFDREEKRKAEVAERAKWGL